MTPRPARKNHVNHERWLVSYADFITLLFAFFVVLFAFAKADQKKQVQVAVSIDSAFHSLGLFPFTMAPEGKGAASSKTDTEMFPANATMGEDARTPAKVKDDLEHVKRDLEKKLSSQLALHTVSITMGRDGLVISLREAGFFSSGSASPKPETMPALRQIASSLGQSPYDLRVEGHTDNHPIHTSEFDSNWELSAARATRITRIFLDLKALPPDRISAAGYAQFHPAASNETPEGRAENRRVDLVVLPRTKINFAAGAKPQANGEWRKITDDKPAGDSAKSAQ